ncbi:Ig-like domain-containing protein [Engelhardtia mirabilis]|uniref:SbsA Ig-like domain-containing protein n=1 Tax=Engelhardtia mirabilis TaxID=2528011 RepID=A0A518BNR8_9BACT|nr:hypothetical protein Pla133_37260 [Planctomycetes bacterium Pla133]QDV02952.1 hypothetical protein Pla86_37250 [Planctomycetes bacterium Pla86]
MFKGNYLLVPSLFAAALALASCGVGGGSVTNLSVESITQDLTVDPDGMTTVFAFGGDAPQLTPGNFQSDGTAVPTSAVVSGSSITVEWDERVTPSDQVRIVGVSGIDDDLRAVTTTDASSPTYTITSAVQGVGLGNDGLVIQFSGPRVAPELVAVGANWSLLVDGSAFPMNASALGWNATDQQLTILTDGTVNVHTLFSLRVTGVTSVADTPVGNTPVLGFATGDVVPPTLVSANQALGQDEFGRVIEFTFSEAMDPAFSTQATNFSTGLFLFATAISQPSPSVIRATFPVPVIPGLNSVGLYGLVDAHGNEFPTGVQAISAGSLVANAYSVDPELRTVSGVGGDQVIATTVQALEPESAEDPSNWSLDVDGGSVDLSLQTLDYDLLTKTLTITLVDDATNGLSFDLTPSGPIDVDGEAFAVPFSGFVDGDVLLPEVLTVVQNRVLDPTGKTVDVTFDEDVDETTAENTANWTASGGLTVTAAVRQVDASVVRLTLDGPAIPDENTFDVAGVLDVAGNAMDAITTLAVTSTDTVEPLAVGADAVGNAGLDNDTVVVLFDDDMVPADVEDPSHWTIESPVGTALDTSAATISYSVTQRRATLTFDGGDGIDFFVDDDFSVAVADVRDLGGNTITPGTLDGTVDVERRQPSIDSVYVRNSPQDNRVVVVFDEPVMEPDSFVTAELEDGADALLGVPAAVAWDAMTPREIEFTFSQVVTPGVYEINLRGVLDTAGNPFFAVENRGISAQDSSELGLGGASAVTSLSGEANDTLTVGFDRRPSGWNLTDLSFYSLTDGGGAVDLTGTELEFDGATTVTLHLPAGIDLQTGDGYTLSIDGLETAQGVVMSGPDAAVIVAAGDAVAPGLAVGRTRLDPADSANSVIVEFDEAVDLTGAVDVTNFEISGTDATTATVVGPRSVHLSFAGGVVVSDTVDVTIDDLAGNAGVVSEAVVAADSVGPLVGTVEAVAVPGVGGDYLRLTFNEPVNASQATSSGNYAITVDSNTLVLTGASMRYSSVGNEVTIAFPDSFDFATGTAVQVTVDAIEDVAGNAMAFPAVLNAVFGGDVTAPDFDAAFVDFRSDATGAQVLVRFDEDVAPAEVQSLGSWTIGGGQTVSAVEQVSNDTFRLTLSAPLGAAETVQHSSVFDVFGNASGVLTATPVH